MFNCFIKTNVKQKNSRSFALGAGSIEISNYPESNLIFRGTILKVVSYLHNQTDQAAISFNHKFFANFKIIALSKSYYIFIPYFWIIKTIFI